MKEQCLEYPEWKPSEESRREVLCALGNGYLVTRGAAEECAADEVHYPGTYLAGGYNRLKSAIADQIIENEDLVNFPNWLCLTFRIGDETSWFRLEETEIIKFRQILNLEQGLLRRELRFKDKAGRETNLITQRFVSMSNPHIAAMSWELTPENWSGEMTIRTALDGSVKNENVPRYRQLNNKHLVIKEKGSVGDESIYLLVQTNQSRIYMAQASLCRVNNGDPALIVKRNTIEEEEKISQDITVTVQTKTPLKIEKIVAIFTSRDHAISEPLIAAQQAISQIYPFEISLKKDTQMSVIEYLLKKHQLAWKRNWNRFNLSLGGPHCVETLIRLHIFHLLQTCSAHTLDLDTGVPARGWHGEAYRGHIFWDELFVYLVFNIHIPDLTKALLLYRYRRLPSARRAARQANLKGALFPWQSGSDGREESQILHFNPDSRRWVADHTWLQRHVNAAIAFNIWRYFVATNDMAFLRFYGAVMFLEITRLFSSLTIYNPERKRFEIRGVVGPDEFHTAYPDSDQIGINNNAYTNFMAAWVFVYAQKILQLLNEGEKQEIMDKLQLTEEELQRWDAISQQMFIPFTKDGLIEQFEGYENLKELDLDSYRKKYLSLKRMDRILEAEGDSINRYRLVKQADVLMIFYLFTAEEITALFQQMNYSFDPQRIPEHIQYYSQYTTDGSSLSYVVRSWVTARSDRKFAWKCLQEVLNTDLQLTEDLTTAEGIHLASMAGTISIIERCFIDMKVEEDILWFNPALPDELTCLEFRISYRGYWLLLHANHQQLSISFETGAPGKVKIGCNTEIIELNMGEKKVFTL